MSWPSRNTVACTVMTSLVTARAGCSPHDTVGATSLIAMRPTTVRPYPGHLLPNVARPVGLRR